MAALLLGQESIQHRPIDLGTLGDLDFGQPDLKGIPRRARDLLARLRFLVTKASELLPELGQPATGLDVRGVSDGGSVADVQRNVAGATLRASENGLAVLTHPALYSREYSPMSSSAEHTRAVENPETGYTVEARVGGRV